MLMLAKHIPTCNIDYMKREFIELPRPEVRNGLLVLSMLAICAAGTFFLSNNPSSTLREPFPGPVMAPAPKPPRLIFDINRF
jgi:hypothetical protein